MLAGLTGTVVGFLGAGNFLFVPLLIYVLKVPIRMAIGSNLIIAVLSTFSGFVGKLLTGQVPFLMALAVVLGAVWGLWAVRGVTARCRHTCCAISMLAWLASSPYRSGLPFSTEVRARWLISPA